ncbi:MAG: M23 family metallopeptidase [Candidatus Spechtbacterales bacterium]|nr:M23 family metallopeptidase [Candidatus Spechtbacterales bacterium]
MQNKNHKIITIFFALVVLGGSLFFINSAFAHPEYTSGWGNCHAYYNTAEYPACAYDVLEPYFGEKTWIAQEIASGESGCNPAALNSGVYSGAGAGLFQIERSVWCGSTATCNGHSVTLSSDRVTCTNQLIQPENNAIVACQLERNRDWWGDWGSVDTSWGTVPPHKCNLVRSVIQNYCPYTSGAEPQGTDGTCGTWSGESGAGGSGPGTCSAMPITPSIVESFNNSFHGEPGSGHGWVRCGSGNCAVDLRPGTSCTSAVENAKDSIDMRSPIDGTVTEVFPVGSFGDCAVITGSGEPIGSASDGAVLCHIDPIVSTGDDVLAGQKVGSLFYSYYETVGCGGSFGPHLHLELKLDGSWVSGDGHGGTWDNIQSAIKNAGMCPSEGSDTIIPGTDFTGVCNTPTLGPITCSVDFPAVPTPGGWFDLNDLCSPGAKITLPALIAYIYYVSLWLSGIIAFISLLYVGVLYILSGANPRNRSVAKERLLAVIWGIAILFLTVVVVNLINPDIARLELTPLAIVNPGDNCLTIGGDDSGEDDSGNNDGTVNPGTPAPDSGIVYPEGMEADGLGYYKMPTSPSGEYLIGTENSAPESQRCGTRDLLGAVYTAITRYNETYPDGPRISLGDLNAGPPHSSHAYGADIDIYGEDGLVIHEDGDDEKTITFGKYLIDTGMVFWIFHDEYSTRNALNNYADSIGSSAYARCASRDASGNPNPTADCNDGHHNHFHVRLNIEHSGDVCSNACGETLSSSYSNCNKSGKW